jgi:hypothetical protein
MLEVLIFWKITDSYLAATSAMEVIVDNEEHLD